MNRGNSPAQDEARPRGKRAGGFSLLGSGLSQFAGQALGILLALAVSHLIARRMGAGPEADAFLLGRRLVTSIIEALNQIVVVAVIPLMALHVASGKSALRAVGRAGLVAVLAGGGLCLAIWLAAPWIVVGLAPDFPSDTASLSIRLLRVFALAIPASAATIVFAAYGNVRGRFGRLAAIRQLPRLAVALALLFSVSAAAFWAATSYVAASALVAFLTLGLVLAVAGPVPSDTSGVRSPQDAAIERRGLAALVLTLGALACIWLETAFAARLGVGGIATLEFGQRLGALLGNTLAMALGLVSLADLSRRAAAGETTELGRRFRLSTLTGLALLVPVELGLFISAPAIVDLLLGYGAFSAEAADGVTQVMRWMTIAPIGALVVRMMLVRLLAEQSLPIVRLVVVSSLVDFGIRYLLFLWLTPRFGVAGLPMALAVAPVAPILVLALALHRRGAFAGRVSRQEAVPILATSLFAVLGVLVGNWLGAGLAGVLQLALSALIGAVGLVGGYLAFKPKLKFR